MTDTAPHPPVTVCRADAERWRDYRGVRLAMLLDEPTAFGSTFMREVELSDENWRERLARVATWLAYDGALPLGSVTMQQSTDQAAQERYLVGMWVAAHARGRGVAQALVRALLDEAAGEGARRVVLHVGEGNARAARFYEGMGFTPTGDTCVLEHQPGIIEVELECLVSPGAFPGFSQPRHGEL
ncbi:MAG TPA: GNAT family N-acetyltransferase [Pedococcus sp.]|jgi:ribosomal protein S18 acetylase RimI-like enzyme|nr:GNAT family N-acetyltransferase [Pedococcus sp.]